MTIAEFAFIMPQIAEAMACYTEFTPDGRLTDATRNLTPKELKRYILSLFEGNSRFEDITEIDYLDGEYSEFYHSKKINGKNHFEPKEMYRYIKYRMKRSRWQGKEVQFHETDSEIIADLELKRIVYKEEINSNEASKSIDIGNMIISHPVLVDSRDAEMPVSEGSHEEIVSELPESHNDGVSEDENILILKEIFDGNKGRNENKLMAALWVSANAYGMISPNLSRREFCKQIAGNSIKDKAVNNIVCKCDLTQNAQGRIYNYHDWDLKVKEGDDDKEKIKKKGREGLFSLCTHFETTLAKYKKVYCADK